MALLMLPSGESREIAPAPGNVFRLDELQQLVGGWVEPIQPPDGRFMCVNEEGKSFKLPCNRQATELARSILRPDDYIAGAVVVMTRAEVGE